ncbi:lipopolysaccharide assembly protein LapA domain-containing protein [Chitinimonas sp. PSY-7]|uniref:lipopolysaccharide assembly protein LapA domain-containing protein n=1 Tax=Chitinimonas sp. PSY-7 TaxID=3459088 RepID=UPI004040291D
MRYLALLVRIVLFLLLFAFALNNADQVSLHGLFGSELRLPLIVLILLCFALGVLVGVGSMLLSQRRLRRQLQENQKKLHAKPAAQSEAEPVVPLDAVL